MATGERRAVAWIRRHGGCVLTETRGMVLTETRGTRGMVLTETQRHGECVLAETRGMKDMSWIAPPLHDEHSANDPCQF